jgi:hypothetical protein
MLFCIIFLKKAPISFCRIFSLGDNKLKVDRPNQAWRSIISGSAQVPHNANGIPGIGAISHGFQMRYLSVAMARSGEYSHIYMNKSYDTIMRDLRMQGISAPCLETKSRQLSPGYTMWFYVAQSSCIPTMNQGWQSLGLWLMGLMWFLAKTQTHKKITKVRKKKKKF